MSNLRTEEQREHSRAYSKAYYEKNKDNGLGEMMRQNSRKYYAEHKNDQEFKAKLSERSKEKHYSLTEEELIAKRERHRLYKNNKAPKFAAYQRKRRALKVNNECTAYTETDVLDMYGSNCHICGTSIDLEAPRRTGKGEGWQNGLHIDHLISLSNGGADSLDNVRPSHSLCNMRKNKYTLLEGVTK